MQIVQRSKLLKMLQSNPFRESDSDSVAQRHFLELEAKLRERKSLFGYVLLKESEWEVIFKAFKRVPSKVRSTSPLLVRIGEILILPVLLGLCFIGFPSMAVVIGVMSAIVFGYMEYRYAQKQ